MLPRGTALECTPQPPAAARHLLSFTSTDPNWFKSRQEILQLYHSSNHHTVLLKIKKAPPFMAEQEVTALWHVENTLKDRCF